MSSSKNLFDKNRKIFYTFQRRGQVTAKIHNQILICAIPKSNPIFFNGAIDIEGQ